MTKKKILIFFPVAPFPLRENGTSLRYLPMLKDLNDRYDVDILVMADIDAEQLEGLGEYCNNYSVVKRPCKHGFSFVEAIRITFSRLLPWTLPYTVECYGINRAIKDIVASVDKNYDAILWTTASYLNFLPELKQRLNIDKVIIDFIDSPYLLLLRSFNQAEPLGLMQRYELWKVKRWEKNMQLFADQSIYISSIDVQSTGVTADDVKVDVIPNGVNVDDFNAGTSIHYPGKTIGYLGNMSYAPNIDAVLWIYDKLLNRLEEPDIKMVIIGKDPDPQIMKLADDPRVIITGMVESIWDHVHAVDIFVLPIFTGAGLQNKVLELMFAGKPLITTDIGNEGIDAIDVEHLYICNDVDGYKNKIQFLFENKFVCEAMAIKSKDFVTEKFNWQRIKSDYGKLVSRCIGE